MLSGNTSAKNVFSRELLLISAEIKDITEYTGNKWWHYVASLGLPALLITPFIVHVGLFNDDFGRAYFGATRWNTDGRIFGEFLYRFAHLGSSRAVLEQPLGALVCLPLMLAGGFFNALIFKRKSIFWPGILAVLIFGQPYFLENLSYSFDAPLMVTAVTMCLLASWLCTLPSRKIYTLVAGSLVTLSLLVYQPANNAFWIPASLLLISRIGASRKAENGASDRGATVNIILKNIVFVELFSALLYKFIFTPFFRLSSYAEHVQKLPSSKEFLPSLLSNLKDFANHLIQDGISSPLGITISIYIIVSVLVISANPNRTKGTIKLALMFGVLFFSQGLMLALALKSSPQRTFIGFGVFLAAILPIAWISICESRWGKSVKPIIRRVYNFSASLLLWGLISCAFSYGSAFSSQAALNEYYRQVITNAILKNESYMLGRVNSMSILGVSPSSLVVINTVKKYPFLNPMLGGFSGDFRGIDNFREYGLALNRIADSDSNISIVNDDKSEIVLLRSGLEVSIIGDIVRVRFK